MATLAEKWVLETPCPKRILPSTWERTCLGKTILCYVSTWHWVRADDWQDGFAHRPVCLVDRVLRRNFFACHLSRAGDEAFRRGIQRAVALPWPTSGDADLRETTGGHKAAFPIGCRCLVLLPNAFASRGSMRQPSSHLAEKWTPRESHCFLSELLGPRL